MQILRRLCLNVLSSIFVILPSLAAAGELTGFVALEHRHFLQPETFSGQRHGSLPSLILEPEYYHISDNQKDTWTARFFWHGDLADDARTHADIRQLDWVHAEDTWELRAGISKVFWGVTESRQLVDVINQVDGVEDTDEEDRLGQPMIQFATFQDWGALRFFYLPYFRERTFPGKEGRLRGPATVETDHVRYAHAAAEWHPDVALRYEHYIGDWDIGLAHFHGTSREPILRVETGRLIPFYELIDQTSLDLQYTTGAWLWKLEAIGRGGQGDYFGAINTGFEYTFFGIRGTNHDLGVLLEYHRDGRDINAPPTLFEHDIFLGFRYTLNDVSDTEFLGGLTADVTDASTFAVFEASHRINTHWKVEFDARLFFNQDDQSFANAFEQDDLVQLRLSYFF